MKTLECIRRISLFLFILMYVFSGWMASVLSIEQSLLKFAFIVTFSIGTLFLKSRNLISKDILVFVMLLFMLPVVDVLFCWPYRFEWNMIIHISVFLIFVYKSLPDKTLSAIGLALKINGVVCVCSALVLYFTYGFYYRSLGIVDKSLMSSIFPLCLATCWIEFIQGKHRVLNISIIILVLIVNIFIVVSKTTFIAFGTFCVIYYFCLPKDQKYLYRNILKRLVPVIFLILLFFPDIALPNDMKETIIYIAGYEVLELDRVRVENTFSMRNDLLYTCLNLFAEYPFLGIGLGNFPYYNKGYFSEIGETESSVLQIITEGGLFYTVLMFTFYWYVIQYVVKNNKRNFSYQNSLVMAFPIIYLIISFTNDFMDNMYWAFMGITCSYIYRNKLSNVVDGKMIKKQGAKK